MRLPRFEYVYVLWSYEFPWRCKVGYSNSPELRRREIQDSISRELGRSIRVYTFFKAPIVGAKAFEQAIHGAINRLRCWTMVGSGRTEWFWIFNITCSILTGLFCWAFNIEAPSTKAFFVLFMPIPLDAALCVLLMALLEYAVIVAALYGAYSFIF